MIQVLEMRCVVRCNWQNVMSEMRARKRFGQHFLTDKNILNNMAMAIGPQQDDCLVEIGPGRGALTDFLYPALKTLHVIEIDRDLIAYLKTRFASGEQLIIHEGDVLSFDFDTLCAGNTVRIVGNLPYNISTPLLFKLFEHASHIKDMYFLLQLEVVNRLTAPVGSKNYGRLSVMSQYFCESTSLFQVGPNAFTPPPKVESAFIQMVPRTPSILANDIRALSLVVREAFSYRRKTLQNALKKLVTAEQLQSLHIDPRTRPQHVSVEDYVRISHLIQID